MICSDHSCVIRRELRCRCCLNVRPAIHLLPGCWSCRSGGLGTVMGDSAVTCHGWQNSPRKAWVIMMDTAASLQGVASPHTPQKIHMNPQCIFHLKTQRLQGSAPSGSVCSLQRVGPTTGPNTRSSSGPPRHHHSADGIGRHPGRDHRHAASPHPSRRHTHVSAGPPRSRPRSRDEDTIGPTARRCTCQCELLPDSESRCRVADGQ